MTEAADADDPDVDDPGDPERPVLDALDALGVPYERIEIDPDHADTVVFCERYGCPPEKAANTIVVATKKKPRSFAACLVLATHRLDVNHKVRQLLGGGRASFARAEDMASLTGMLEGGVTPFALPPDLPIYVDETIMSLDWIVVGTGGRNSKIRISPEVFLRLPNATVVADLSRPRGGP